MDISNTAGVNTSIGSVTDTPYSGEVKGDIGFDGDSILDIVPPSLKKAVKGDANDTSSRTVSTKANVKVDPVETDDSDDEEEDTETEEVSTTTDSDEDESEESAAEEEDLDTSDEALEKLLKGDDAAVKKTKAKESEEEEFPWKSNEIYQEIIKRGGYSGVTPEALDKLIKGAVDSAVVTNSALTKGYKDKIKTFETQAEATTRELARLKQVEKHANFEFDEDTQTKFNVPMDAEVLGITKILQLEGSEIPVKSYIDAKNRQELNKLFTEDSLDDDSVAKITQHWKNFRSLSEERNTARAEAKNGLKASLSTKVAPEAITNIFKKTVGDVLENTELKEFDYIREAISGNYDADEHELARNVLAATKRDFSSLAAALASPGEHVGNTDWMHKLQRYVFKANHNSALVPQLAQVKTELSKRSEQVQKLTKEILRLRESAKGIKGTSGGDIRQAVKTSDKNGSKKGPSLERFQNYLSGKSSFEDLLSFKDN